MHPNVPAVIRRARERNLFVNLITNGTLLADALPALLRDRPSVISISLNAANAQEHAAECGVPGMWDKIMEAFEKIAYYQGQWERSCAKDPGLPVFLSRVCTAQNLDRVPEFLDLAASLDVDGVDLHNVLPHDVGTPEKLEAFLGTVLTLNHAAKIFELKELPTAKLVRSWPTMIDPANPVRRCEFVFNAIAIDGNRNVSICNSIWPPNPANGTYRDPKCWHSDYCEQLRLAFAKDEELSPACKYCFRNYQ
jgi:MoaA/NifB/PqqE/SkfB family radical SAM enzyme